MDTNNELIQAIGQMMDEKLKPIQADIAALKQGQTKLEQGQADLQESLQIVRNSQMKVELEQYPRIAAALDGVVGSIQKDEEHNERITYLEKKADIHDARLFALESTVKKA